MRALRRFVVSVPLLFVMVSFGVFGLVALAPGDPAVQIAGQDAPQEAIDRVRGELGLDRSLVVRYLDWLGGVVRGDLGQSIVRNQDVGELLLSRIPPTLSIVVVALVITLAAGLTLGTIAAIRQGSWADRLIGAFAAAGIALPQFWVGLVLVIVFSLQLDVLPATGYSPLSDGPGAWLAHIVLPATALGWLPAAELARHVRTATAEVLDRDHVLTAWAKGLTLRPIALRHVLRNAGIPVVTVLGTRLAQLLGGAVVVETVFGIPGLGALTVDSVLARDMPVVLSTVALTTAVVLVINFLVDLSYGLIDPRTAVRS